MAIPHRCTAVPAPLRGPNGFRHNASRLIIVGKTVIVPEEYRIFSKVMIAGSIESREESQKTMPHAAEKDAQLSLYIKFLKERLFFEPTSATMHYNLGLAYSHKGLLDEAISEFKQAVECDPGLAEALVNAGGLMFRKGDLEQCIEYNLKALAIDQNLPSAHGNLGFAYLQKKDFRKAIESSAEATRLAPGFIRAYNTLALAHLGAGEPEASIEASNKILSVNDRYAPAHYALSVAYNMMGQIEKAKEHLEIARDLGYPVDEEVPPEWEATR
jgi:tetratricopeptide (TPR) repeat protein